LDKLQQLSEILKEPRSQYETELSYEEATGELGRLRIWAGNIGALQDSHLPTSLEYRLREAPKLVTRILNILEDVSDSLEDGKVLRSSDTWMHSDVYSYCYRDRGKTEPYR
jgi:hypothetical protein